MKRDNKGRRRKIDCSGEAETLGDLMKSKHYAEELHTTEGYTKLLTSFGLLIPALNGLLFNSSHEFVKQYDAENFPRTFLFASLLNPLAWSILTLGCFMHHAQPQSSFWHDCDHWAAQIAANLVLLYLEGSRHPVVGTFFVLNVCFFIMTNSMVLSTNYYSSILHGVDICFSELSSSPVRYPDAGYVDALSFPKSSWLCKWGSDSISFCSTTRAYPICALFVARFDGASWVFYDKILHCLS